MADKKKKRNVFQWLGDTVKEIVEWVEATFADPALTQETLQDLGLDPSNPATPALAPNDPRRQKIDELLAKEDVDEQALAATVVQIASLADTIMVFADSVKADGVTAEDVFWLVFKVWVADSLRVRNPSAYALCVLAGMILEDDEMLAQLDPAPVVRLLEGKADGSDADALIDRLSAFGGGILVILDQVVKPVGNVIDTMYGWDPEPGTDLAAAGAASRALTVAFNLGGPLKPTLTIIPVTRDNGGPGLLISAGGHLVFEHETESATYTTDIGANGAFSLFFRFDTDNPGFRAFGAGAPTLDIGVKPTIKDGKPFLVFGTTNATRLEIGGFSYGVELGADHAGFKTHVRKGKLVISLGDGDGFLAKLPGGAIEVPFELGLLMDTQHGVRFDGGTGLKVDLPVAASLFGVFTIQYVALELKLAADPALEVRGGFSLRLGPFQASVDQLGAALNLAAITDGVSEAGINDLVKFLPPKGIGLALDLGPVKGGGYLYIDAEKGEYAGALELKIIVFSIKAIALLTTKRPDGSDGWSLLIFIFGQFRVHVAFGIFWTGLGGMVGLHHRADLDALTAGMKTGALDDVLFPENPVADAPRIINRYKQLFPVESDSLLLGPMLEMSFSQPPIVYVRLGLIFEIRNALGGDEPAELTKVILLGQLLVQLPPKELGVPAIVKLLVDVVGFYDNDDKFLLIRARLRDSFVGIEGLIKLDLTGELLLAMRFGDDPSFVLSAGGFHPSFKDLPRGVPGDLERMAVSFGIGVVKLRYEAYFAITSNTVQGGAKVEVKGDISIASIKGHLSFDAILFLTPRFRFVVDLEFKVSVEVFGEELAGITVHAALEGPGQWRIKGYFKFKIFLLKKDIPFDESWGSAPEVEPPKTSATALLRTELADPSRLLPGGPVGGNSLVTLAEAPKGANLAHPLAVVTIAQKAVPFDVTIDRLGTKRLDEGSPTYTITDVLVGGVSSTSRELVTDHFARGQFMELTEQQKLEGRSFETFTSGVRVGTESYRVAGTGTPVKADYEVEILEPEQRMNLHWKVATRFREVLGFDTADVLSRYGAAAGSARARAAELNPEVGKAAVREVPLAVVDADTLQEQATVLVGPASSEAIAGQFAAATGGLVVESFEVVL